jgi:uncharacterized protein (DUF1800 family)
MPEQPTMADNDKTQPFGPIRNPGPVESVAQKKPSSLVSRRKLFIGAGVGVATIAAGGVALAEIAQHGGFGQSSASANSSTIQGTNAQIGHLLRRAGFGATSAELATYTAPGFTGAVDRLLNYQQVSEDDTENRLKALNLDLNKPTQQQQWWLLRMAWTQRPLLEKMTLFWSGHFTSSFRKVGGPNTYMRMIVQNQFLRDHAFDTFDNLLLGITADPAMLFYLDLTQSRKNAPNENYARELMELFTLGLGHYTQQDVYNGAAALTGWHTKRTDPLTSQYSVNDHSQLTKTFLGHTGNLDYKDVVNILANHPATPWFLARKLFTFFAYENPSDDNVKPLVDTYIQSNHNMGAVMRTLLLSPQFSSQKAYRNRVKSPTEFVVGVYRSLQINSEGRELPIETTIMGQPLFDPPNVAGWPADKTSAFWLNGGTWMARLNYINALVTSNNARTGVKAIDYQSIIQANHIDTPEHFVDYFSSFLLDGNLDADRRTQLIDYFSAPAATTAKGKVQQVTLTSGKSYPLNTVRGTLYLLMSLPEYQLN